MRFIGIDVQSNRRCAFAVLDERCRLVDSGWLDAPEPESARTLAARHPDPSIGIDAPRRPLPQARAWYWDGHHRTWRRRRASDHGTGRHCEVVIRAHQLANPQWTPLKHRAPPWMRLGFELFRSLSAFRVYEVFPSASYRLLSGERKPVIAVNLAEFALGPKDMLDAVVAAVTVREYVAHRGSAVGGGDGLGEIVLPRSLRRPIPAVLVWPESHGPPEDAALMKPWPA